ncbi:phage tail protein [Pasteurellaceae bacterium RH1A]|nr:phage tail protein [Pasteurellaceae bacterium RH1A]
MAKLVYADMIANDSKYKALADLSLKLPQLNIDSIMTTLVELLGDEFLPLLAEKWSVTGDDGLLIADSDNTKRNLIKKAVELHRHKGTPWAVREVLRQLGFGEIDLDEGLKKRDYSSHTGVAQIPAVERWAHYAVRLNQPITNDQALNIRKILRAFAPARCTLAVLDYKAAAFRYNNKIRYNGMYNYGSV